MGSIYKRGEVYWIKYYRAGKSFRESAHTDKETEAKRLLRMREGQIVTGTFPGLRVERIRFDELAEDLVNDYKVNGRRSLGRVELSIEHLKGHFGGMRAADITTDRIKTYIVFRQEAGAANGTINRELTALKRSFNLAAKSTPPKAAKVPFIPMLREAAPRSGFMSKEDMQALRAALPDHLRVLVTVGFYTGMRRGELLGLKWDDVDFREKRIALQADATKTGEARTIYLDGELFEAVEKQKAYRDWIAPSCPWVFFRVDKEGGKKVAKPIRNFITAWETACGKVGLVGRIFHDLRRSAVRFMVMSGVPERVAMKISGHKTRAIFDRYHIVNEADLRSAAAMVSGKAPDSGHNSGHNQAKEAAQAPVAEEGSGA